MLAGIKTIICFAVTVISVTSVVAADLEAGTVAIKRDGYAT